MRAACFFFRMNSNAFALPRFVDGVRRALRGTSPMKELPNVVSWMGRPRSARTREFEEPGIELEDRGDADDEASGELVSEPDSDEFVVSDGTAPSTS